jgi:sirohydrochlorin cobaltochelatase
VSHEALILAAHGAGDGSPANARLLDLGRQLADRGDFAEVVVAFQRGTPSYTAALDSLSAPAVTVVPVMSSDGYFRRCALPAALAQSDRAKTWHLRITPPLGLHPELPAAVLGLIEGACANFAVRSAEAAFIVVGHGTRRNTKSRESTQRLRDALASRLPHRQMTAAFLDEPPMVEDVVAELTGRDSEQSESAERASPSRVHAVPQDLVIVPFLLGGGHHATTDIPTRLGLAPPQSNGSAVQVDTGAYRVLFVPPLLESARLVDLIASLAAGPADDLHDLLQESQA